ncbi:MAG: L,D-transpeptidase family protein, partial [Gammaproteobacteria bacterium]|nr:L,D-transpeptidase family protein [Gammaproteobacteria bacterium]
MNKKGKSLWCSTLPGKVIMRGMQPTGTISAAGNTMILVRPLWLFYLLIVLIMTAVTTRQAMASVYEMPTTGDLIGEVTTVIASKDDTLLELALTYNLGYNEIVAANPDIDPWLPHEGAEVILPSRFILPDVVRKGVIINLAEMRLYYFPPPGEDGRAWVVTHPIGIGKEGWSTPTGGARIVSKRENPSWTVPASLIEEKRLEGVDHPKVIPPGPDNPLGTHALRLSMPSYLIHGTNQPYGVGRRVSHGCIRLYPDSIADLFQRVPVNTPVMIVNKPFKAGYGEDGLYLEVHKPLDEVSDAEVDELTVMLTGFGVIAGLNTAEDNHQAKNAENNEVTATPPDDETHLALDAAPHEQVAATASWPTELSSGLVEEEQSNKLPAAPSTQTALDRIKGIAQFQDGLPHMVLKGAQPPS